MAKKYKFQPNYAVHPGETLREKLEELNMSPKELAVRTGKPIKTISNVLNGKSAITPEMAIQFERVLGIPASFWMRKQANYNEYLARQEHEKEIERAIEWAKKFPYSALAKAGYVKNTRVFKERAKELLNFFNISRAEAWESIYLKQKTPIFFRISLTHTKDPYALSALLRIGEIEASKLSAPPFDKNKLKSILPELKAIMRMEPEDFLDQIQEYCLEAGVKVVYTTNLPKTVINGVVRWINDNPVIQMTDRFKRYDIFWFSLFHELGHIILHGKKKNIFLDEVTYADSNDEKEQEANEFATEFLLSNDQYRQIVREIQTRAATPEEILRIIDDFAIKFGTHRDIIIGRILFYNKSLYKRGFLQRKLRKIEFGERKMSKEKGKTTL